MVLSNDIKKAIAFGLIIGAIISICNLCFAVENVDVIPIENTQFTYDNPIVSYMQSQSIGYFPIEPGYKYSITNNAYFEKYIGFSNNVVEIGDTVSVLSPLISGDTFTFTGSQYGYLYFNYYNVNDNMVITREPLEGMSNFIDQLSYSLTNDGIYETFLACVPLIALGVLFGLSIFFIVRLIYGIIKIRGGF